MKTALAILALLSVALVIPSYAAEVQFPVLPTDKMTGMDVKTFYPSNSTYIIQISVHYTVEHPLEVLQQFTWTDITGQTITIPIQGEFTEKHYPQDIVADPILKPLVSAEHAERIIQEKREEQKAAEDSAFTKLRQCLEEFEEEQPTRFKAWQRTATLSEFEIPDQWISSDTYDRFELEAQKKWVICEALKTYPHIGIYEANKIIDSLESQSLIDTDSPDTVPVTEEMMQFEAQKAADFSCSTQGIQQGLCKDYLAGDKYDKPDPRIPSWYNTAREMQAVGNDANAALEKARQTQCDIYYSLYNATNAIEIPQWLSHCEEQ